jgi:hypothetical protein
MELNGAVQIKKEKKKNNNGNAMQLAEDWETKFPGNWASQSSQLRCRVVF